MIIRNNKGTSILEFSMIAVLFFGAVFLIVDLGMMLYVNLTMQHAVREGARYAITGQDNLSPDGRRAAVVQKIRDNSIGLCDKYPCSINFFKLNEPDPIPFDPGDPRSGDVGNPSEIIIVSLDYSWPLITPIVKPFFSDGAYSFTVRSAMRNEPFPT